MFTIIGMIILMAIAAIAYPLFIAVVMYFFLGNMLLLDGFKKSDSDFLGYIAASLYFPMIANFIFLFLSAKFFYVILIFCILYAIVFYLHSLYCKHKNEENRLFKDITFCFANPDARETFEYLAKLVILYAVSFLIIFVEIEIIN